MRPNAGTSSMRATAAILAAVGCYYAVFSYLTPLGGDSIRFIYDYNLYSDGGRQNFGVAFARFAGYMREFDNGRFDNLLAFVFLNTMPQWAAAIFLGACAAITTGCLARLATRQTNPRAALLAAFFIMLLFPWRERGITLVNAFNMLTPSAVTLGYISVFTHRRHIRGAMWIPVLMLGVTAGGIHEGYAAPVLGSLAVMVALRRIRPDVTALTLVSSYVAGCSWVLTSPGMWSRAGVSAGTWGTLFGLFTMTLPILAWTALTVVMLVTGKGRRRLAELSRDTMFLSAAVMSAISLAIVLKSGYNNPRAWWIPCLFATLMLLMQLSPWLQRARCAIWAVICTLIMTEGAAVLTVQYRSWKIHRYLQSITAASESGTVFHPYNPLSPRYTLLQTVTGLWHEPLYLNSVNFRRTDSRILAVVPPALADITRQQSLAINSHTNPGEGFSLMDATGWQWEHNGEIVAPDSVFVFHHQGGETYLHPSVTGDARFSYPDGSVNRKPAILQRFVTAGGDTLLWIHPILRN